MWPARNTDSCIIIVAMDHSPDRFLLAYKSSRKCNDHIIKGSQSDILQPREGFSEWLSSDSFSRIPMEKMA